MRDYLKQLKHTGYLLWLRFLAVFLFTIFALLALGTSLMDVAEAYFNTIIEPLDALTYIVVVYLVILSFYFAFNRLPTSDNKPIKHALMALLLAGALLFMAFPELFPSLPESILDPRFYEDIVTRIDERGERDVKFITWGLIIGEALLTAVVDLDNQWERASETGDEEE